MERKNLNMAQKNVPDVASLLSVVNHQDMDLPEIEGQQSREKEFSLYVRVINQNRRQGTVACLGRSEVNYTNKKPWKQKGTGRARAGSARSPLWRGGGVIFGPQQRDRVLKIGKKQRRSVLYGLYAALVKAGKIFQGDWEFKSDLPKTAPAFAYVKNAALLDKRVILFLEPTDTHIYASFLNIPQVRILFFDQGNAVDLAGADCWLFLKKDYESFKKMVSQWACKE